MSDLFEGTVGAITMMSGQNKSYVSVFPLSGTDFVLVGLSG